MIKLSLKFLSGFVSQLVEAAGIRIVQRNWFNLRKTRSAKSSLQRD